MPLSFHAFCDELIKIADFAKEALTPASIQQMLQAAKKKQVRKGLSAGIGYGFSAPKKEVSRQLRKFVSGTGIGEDTATLTGLEEAAKALPFYGWGGRGGGILTPEVGDAKRFFGRFAGAAPGMSEALSGVRTSGQRKALEAVVKGHELAESQVKPSMSFAAFGHRSPDVILREHNMIQTLPKGMEQAAEPMRRLRAAQGEAAALKAGTGFEFGKGPRVSRHARKRISEMHEKATTQRAQEMVQQLKDEGLL